MQYVKEFIHLIDILMSIFFGFFVKCHLFVLHHVNVKTIFLLISRLYMLILAKQCGNT